MLDLIRMDDNGNVVLTQSGSELAMLPTPIINSVDRSTLGALQSPISEDEAMFLLNQIKVLFPNEFEDGRFTNLPEKSA